MRIKKQRTVIVPIAAAALTLGISVGASAAGKHSGGHGDAKHGMEKPGHMSDMKDAHEKAGAHHGSDDHHGGGIGEQGKMSEVSRTIEILMTENLYSPESISVKKGETIRFIVKNKGEFVHEFNIGTAAMHAAHQKEMMTMFEHGMIEPDKINHERMKMDMGGGHAMQHDDPNSVLLEPGKSGEVIWKFSKSAKLEFACNVPGHYEAGMMGHIRFK